MDERRTCTHTHNQGGVKTGQVKTALAYAIKFRHSYAFDTVKVLFHVRRANTGHKHLVNLLNCYTVFIGKFSKSTVSRSERIVGSYKLWLDKMRAAVVGAKTYYFRGAATHVYTNYNTHFFSLAPAIRFSKERPYLSAMSLA